MKRCKRRRRPVSPRSTIFECEDHVMGPECWCSPRVEKVPFGGYIYIHRDVDEAH